MTVIDGGNNSGNSMFILGGCSTTNGIVDTHERMKTEH